MATCSLDRWLSVATDTYPALLVLFNALLVFSCYETLVVPFIVATVQVS